MESELQSRLREMSIILGRRLTINNVREIAHAMWSRGHLDLTARESIESCTLVDKAVGELVKCVITKGDASIIGLAEAFIHIERKDLAKELYPEAFTTNHHPLSHGARGSFKQHGSDAAAKRNGKQLPQRDDACLSLPQPSHAPPEAQVSQSASHRQTEALQPTQAGVSFEAKRLYVAVLFRMSKRNTHLEVQALMDSNESVLLSWLRAWKAKESELPDMPSPKPVNLPGVSLDQSIVAILTSTGNDGATVCFHSCHETRNAPLRGYAKLKPRAWLFKLTDELQSEQRPLFTLSLHTASPTLGDKICEAFSIKDVNGSCFLHQLGFTLNNQTVQRRAPGAALFARPETAGGVHAVETMTTVIEQAKSVGQIWLTNGSDRGTGFCVGKNQKKYVLTCHHVLKDYKAALDDGKVCIKFGHSPNGNSTPFILSSCVAEDEKLDYAILAFKDAANAPLPLSCCSTDLQGYVQLEDVAGRYLTIVGYFSYIQAIDIAVDWLMPTEQDIIKVKDAVAEQWSQFRSHVNDYDKMLDFASDVIFYNVARHKHGSSGSPVFQCKQDLSVQLIALHRRGFPDFYYNDDTKVDAQKLIPVQYTVEAGTRMSAIYEDLRFRNAELCQEIFDNEPQPMDE